MSRAEAPSPPPTPETDTLRPDTSNPEVVLAEGRAVLHREARAVAGLADRLDEGFVEAVRILGDTTGRIIVTGVGKSGIVARKVAATLTSTGTPASFLHPVDGLHGDLGIVSREDAAIFISKSGGTAELHGLMEYMVRLGLPIVALVGQTDSALGRAATVALDCGVSQEACPLDLAPTSSTTAALAMGDALAMVLLQSRGFQASDFARFHPGGALGRRLTLRVEDVMVADELPAVPSEARVKDLIVPLGHLRGTVPVVDGEHRVVGVVTTGDLARLMDQRPDFLDLPVTEVMTRSPRITRPDRLAGAVLHDMEEHGIMALPVVDEDGRLLGMAHLHDLLRSEVA
ncbi:MAG: KpsF/GutQ family sugar-phosphate isomerase [Gemmatimonadales bacterium]|nr:MAG: KpsF/GutQ family sugar-phosphate isomerase [Gemmatimonadales bacterium]